MTSITDMLESIIEDADEFDALKDIAFESHGILIDGLYCLHTGKVIGQYSRYEIEFAIADEPCDSQEDLIDALAVRVVASMRPSPALNKPDHITIRSLCTKRPVDGLAYLLNRLYGTRDLLIKRNGELSFSPLFDRIMTYSKLERLSDEGFDLNPWTHWLLEMDSKVNLHDVTAPLFEKDRLGKWLITKTGKPLIEVIDSQDKGLLECFESWVFARLDDYNARDTQMTREARWVRGNSMTRSAYLRSWLENPGLVKKVEIANKKAQEAYNKKQTPGRPKSEKTKKLDERVSKFMSMLTDVIDGNYEAPTPKPVPPKLKLNLNAISKHIKKDS